MNFCNLISQDKNKVSDDDFSSESEIPLALLEKPVRRKQEEIKVKKQVYKWEDNDLVPDNIFSTVRMMNKIKSNVLYSCFPIFSMMP